MNDKLAAFPQRALEWALALAKSTFPTLIDPAAPSAAYLPAGVVLPAMCYLLFCSLAVHPFSEEQLADLQEQADTYNKAHNLTGLLCYHEGHFVQVMEGPTAEVNRLFSKILRDRRHHHVRLLCCGTSPVRWFSDWHMAFAKPATSEYYWLIGYMEAHRSRLLLPQVPIPEPELVPLLHAFSNTCTESIAHTKHQVLAA